VGILAGFGLPALLHYRPRHEPVARAYDPLTVRAMVVPLVRENEVGIGVAGLF